MTHKTLVIIGPSGAGKSTLAHYLARHHGFSITKTFTTRTQRGIHDDDHEFIDQATFIRMKDTGKFLGTLSIFGADYGLPFLDTTKRNIVLLRAPAVKEFLSHHADSFVVQVSAPMAVLVERLKNRNSYDRIDEVFLTKEIEAGNSLANLTVDSTVPIVDCAASIMKEITK